MVLNSAMANQINEQYQILLDKGEVLSDDKLAEYYETFRRKFGPERLAGLDGEELLEYMHNSTNHDSLVYWLEFKNDDELPNRFGSIAGGSALKFGIYRRRETGGWVTGSPQKQVQLTVEQAILVARKHREQLLEGAKLLEKLPREANHSQYISLQGEMDQLIPDICDTAWGHKYFHMLFPDKLEDFHSAYYQRFHLIKMMQIPVAPQGRFAISGQFMEIARELGMHINNFTRILNELNGRPHKYWAIKANYADKRWKNWETMRDNGFVCISWDELGDLSDIKYDVASRSKVKKLMKETYREKGGYAQEVFNFIAVMAEGDIVIATEGGERVLGVGKITGNYYYDPASEFRHRHSVEWLSDTTWNLPEDVLKARVVRQLSSPENLVEIEKQILGLSMPVVLPKGFIKKHNAFSGMVARVSDILERKRQVILYGPPGTGKTYWAYQAAITIAAHDAYGQDFSQLTDEQKITVIGNDQSVGLVRLCTFHPSYGYEDFIEGYKPRSNNGVLTFEERSGIFKTICQNSHKQPDRRFFLIIDEINRGDIPRIFGELLTILEKDKRGRSLFLPISGEAFSVPDNVYIVGTMNTADRSIALLDTALRRRFGFIELMPDPSTLGTATLESIPLGPWLEALNQRILKSVGRDARNLQVGHAYLMEKGVPFADFARFVRALQDDIIPLLEEYCYEDYDALEKILGKGLVDREKQRVRHELFELARRDDLIQALGEPSPEITASLAAIQQDQNLETTDDDVDE
jgi:5-methylcytosine-specific restriction enzyme B